MSSTHRAPLRRLAACAVAATIALVSFGGPAIAGKGGGGKGGGGKGGGDSSTLTLVPLSDPVVNHKDKITFSATTSTAEPFVSVNCHQAGTLVYSGSIGLFDSYPWAQELTLDSSLWVSGAADCDAVLYTTKTGTRITTLATLSFVAEA